MDEKRESAIRENLDYDRDTGKLFWINNRGRNYIKGKEAGSCKSGGYIHVEILGKKILAHRIAWFLYYGKWPEKHIDHINGDTADNRIENLRDVTHRANMDNMELHRNGRLAGVNPDKRRVKNQWRARLRLNGKRVHLGCFPTEEEANAAYLAAVRKEAL